MSDGCSGTAIGRVVHPWNLEEEVSARLAGVQGKPEVTVVIGSYVFCPDYGPPGNTLA